MVFPTFEREFVEFLFKQGALKFGDTWKLKSGRMSPYFLNIGAVDNGPGLNKLGKSYAALIADLVGKEIVPKPTLLWGPAYKGIPLAVATTMYLDSDHGISVKYACDRKESKKVGEGTGIEVKILGAKPTDEDRILIVEDVFTTGATKEDAVENINALTTNPTIDGVIIALDRAETSADGSMTAIDAFKDKYGIATFSVSDTYRMKEILHNVLVDGKIALNDENYAKVEAYLKEFGTQEA